MWLLKLSLFALAVWMLVRCGLNPFWSVLVLLYWKTVVVLGLFVLGLAWFAHTVMN